MVCKVDVDRNIMQSRCKTLNQLQMILDLSYLPTKDYRVVHSISELKKYISEASQNPIVAVDVETTGRNIYNLKDSNPIKDKIVGMSLSWKRDFGIYIPFEHKKFKNIDKREAFKMLMPFLETHAFVTHNGLFDGRVFYDEGIKLNITQDTFILYFNIDSRVSKGSKGLKPLTQRMYHHDVIELDDIFGATDDYGLFMYLDEDLVKSYACADADYTYSLLLDSLDFLKPKQMQEYMFDIRVLNELIRTEYNGKGTDQKLAKILNDANDHDIIELENKIYNYTGFMLSAMDGDPDVNNIYKFRLTSNPEVEHVFFDLLKYPIISTNDRGLPVLDDKVLEALMRHQYEPGEAGSIDESSILQKLFPNDLKTDAVNYKLPWMQGNDKDSILIDAKLLRKLKYKLAYLFQTYRALVKVKGTFFSKFINDSLEGKYFSDISMTNADTARIIDVFQTLKGNLKRIIVPFDQKSQYLLDYDHMQIEYRYMIGLACMLELVKVLEDPERDYHREGGSLMLGKPPDKITKSERDGIKSVNFGKAYAMGILGMVTKQYGIGLSDSERKEAVIKVKEIHRLWDIGLAPIKRLLDTFRDKACERVPDALLPPPLRGTPSSVIYNQSGRQRVFDLTDTSESKLASIRRQAGNYPIQSGARDVFCTGLIRLCARLKKEGLIDIRVKDDTKASGYRFENKVFIMAPVHDENLMCADKSVNPLFLYQIIYEECMLKIPGHPTYFCGISIAPNWYVAHKDDNYEAPVNFVREVVASKPSKFVESTDYDAVAVTFPMIAEYLHRRILQVLLETQPTIATTKCVDVVSLLDSCENYYVKNKMVSFYGKARSVNKDEQRWNDIQAAALEVFLAKEYGSIKCIYPDFVRNVEYDSIKDKCVVVSGIKEHDLEDFEESAEDATQDQFGFVTDVTNNLATLTNAFQSNALRW